MATAGQAMDSARAHLNDVGATIWTNTVLLPFVQEAHRELRNKLVLNGVPVIDKVTAVLSVPAYTTDLTTAAGYPTDMVVPLWLKERNVGDDNSDFIDMNQRDFIPNAMQDIWLYWWAWIGEKIYFIGSTQDEEVQLRYRRQITTPSGVSSDLGFINAEIYISYRIASMACNSIGEIDKGKMLQETSMVNLDEVIRLNVKQMQGLPARRRPYHRRYSNNTIVRGI